LEITCREGFTLKNDTEKARAAATDPAPYYEKTVNGVATGMTAA